MSSQRVTRLISALRIERRPRGRRQLAIGLLVTVSASCASGTARPTAFPGALPAPVDVRLPGPVADLDAVLATARAFEGTPYRFGGDTPEAGFDCSGFVRFVYGRHQIVLPRTTEAQFTTGARIANDRVSAGDLVFFSTIGPGPTHVGIALDRVTFVHAPGTGAVVRTERFDTPYWQSRRLGNRRVAPR